MNVPKLRRDSVSLTLVLLAASASSLDAQVVTELDAFWTEVSRTVAEGDFEGYADTYHPDAVVIFGSTTQPIAAALAGWEQGFADTRAGRVAASVDFRFSDRRNDGTTAHETGIFRYEARSASGEGAAQFMRFEALLVKRDGWKMLMEFQRDPATEADWAALEDGRRSAPTRQGAYDSPRALLDAWVELWGTYDLDRVEDLFVRDDRLTYFSSEFEGIIQGYDEIVEHHRGFGFEPGGSERTERIWVEDVVVVDFGPTAMVGAIWFFGDPATPDGAQRGPMTLLAVRDGSGYRIGHMNFATYADTGEPE